MAHVGMYVIRCRLITYVRNLKTFGFIKIAKRLQKNGC